MELKDAIHVSFQPKRHGILVTKHFCCSLCVMEEKNPQVVINADYCLARVTTRYSASQPLRHVFHFYAIFDLPTCRKVTVIVYSHAALQIYLKQFINYNTM